jgi:hypothetical protein
MKKAILYLSCLTLILAGCRAQFKGDAVSDEIVKNAPFIINGYFIEKIYCNCLSTEFYDLIIKYKLTEVYRGKNLHVGDTILLFNPQVGDGNKETGSLIDISGVQTVKFICPEINGFTLGLKVNTWGGGQFLTLNKDLIIDSKFKNTPLYILYPSNTCSCFAPKSFSNFSDEKYAYKGLNGLTFKTKQDWYNYLKQFPDIKIPGEK